MPTELSIAIKTHQATFGLDLADETIKLLDKYHGLLLEHNPILHLIGPMDAEEFAVRHVLESLTMLRHLPEGVRFADVGSGGGLPALPCVIARLDLAAVLIESKEKKTNFLKIAVADLGLAKRVDVVTRQFTETDIQGCSVVTCRALDKFTEKLPRLIKWSAGRPMLIFGGPGIREALEKTNARFDEELMPMSQQRFLFVVKNG